MTQAAEKSIRQNVREKEALLHVVLELMFIATLILG